MSYQPAPTRAQTLFMQANQPNSNQGSFLSRNWGKIAIAVVILSVVLGIVFGVVKVGVKTCAGGTPGVGKDKEKGCLCNSGSECTSGMCSTSATTIVSGTSQGKCA
jgi:hypothetical protein